ncbi:MAG: glycosyltransferase [Gaiellales bacterium]
MSRALRILVLANARFPIRQPFAGGLESWTWSLVHGLRARGIEVTVFAGAGTDPVLGAVELVAEPLSLSDAARADVSMPPDVWMQEHHAYLQAMLHVMRADTPFDVVHNASLHYLPLVLRAALGSPMLTTLHTPPTPWLESALRLSGQGACLVAVSRHTAHAWHQVATPLVIPNGIDLAAWPMGAGGDSLVWTGRIVPEKAPHQAALIARAAGMALRIAGPIVDRGYFEQRLVPLLGQRVEYVGHLPQAALSDLVGTSAASLVTPGWDEPYGLVVAESLATGTPVCAFGRGGMVELLNDRCARVVKPGDIVAAARAVREVVKLDRSAVRRHAEGSCGIERMLDSYCAMYRRLTDARAEAS